MIDRIEESNLLLRFFLGGLATLYSSGVHIDDFESLGNFHCLVGHPVSALGFRDFVPGHLIETMSSWIEAMKAYAKQTGKWTVPKKDSPEYEAIRALQLTLPKAEAKVAKVAPEAAPEATKKAPKKVQEVHAAPVGTAPAVVEQPASARRMKKDPVEKQVIHSPPEGTLPPVVGQPPAARVKVAVKDVEDKKAVKAPRVRKVASKSATRIAEVKEVSFD